MNHPLLGSTSSTVYVIAAVLVALGILMIGMTVWLVRSTRRDHVVLGPLDRMGDRSWRRNDPERRRRELDESRPSGARWIEPAPPDGTEQATPADAPVAEESAPEVASETTSDAPVAVAEPEDDETDVRSGADSTPTGDRESLVPQRDDDPQG